MTWRLYARRSTTGLWLHTDVPASIDLTWRLNGAGSAAAFIPAALDSPTGSDGEPMWLERGTTLYAEEDGQLVWVGLCSWQRPTNAGREIEFKGLTSAYDLIAFEDRIRLWQPNPYDMVRRLVDEAHRQVDGDVGIVVVDEDTPATYAGDEEPPHPRPEKVKRRRGESKEHFAERQEDRRKAQEDWDKAYGDRRPYSVAWWEAPYVGEEIAELANEIPFEWIERHRWVDRDAKTAKHELILARRRGRQRDDVSLVQGVNIAEPLDPTTDTDRYGNRVIGLGSGEGRKMRRAAVGASDGRIRTTRYFEAKTVRNQARLAARTRALYDSMGVSVKLDQATMFGDTGGVELGDSVRVTSSVFNGWRRVHGITRNNRNDRTVLDFTPGGNA